MLVNLKKKNRQNSVKMTIYADNNILDKMESIPLNLRHRKLLCSICDTPIIELHELTISGNVFRRNYFKIAKSLFAGNEAIVRQRLDGTHYHCPLCGIQLNSFQTARVHIRTEGVSKTE